MVSNNVVKLGGSPSFDCFSKKQKKAIKQLEIPDQITFLAADRFDDKFIDTNSNTWRFRYSGDNQAILFDKYECPYKIRLLKYLASQYAISNLPTDFENCVLAWAETISWLESQHFKFSKKPLLNLLDGGDLSAFGAGKKQFYHVLFLLRKLGSINFPAIGEGIEDNLVTILRPSNDGFLVYQDADNVIPPHTLSMLTRGLWAQSKELDSGKSFVERDLMDACALGLVYVSGARPVQMDKLAAEDIAEDTSVPKGQIGRYSVAMPYAKTGNLTAETERIRIALPYEVANLLMEYKKVKHLKPTDKLFPTYAKSSKAYIRAINRQILKFSPIEFQRLVKQSKIAKPYYTPTQFRHNVAHSLAMRGADAAEIAFILGHSSLVVAKHYIMATPELARVRYRALGVNATWQNMMALLITGDLTTEKDWDGRKVAGVVGGELHYCLGGCARNCDMCPFAEVRSCYGCLYFRPFIEGNHERVLYGVQKEIVDTMALSDAVGNARNPVLTVLIEMKENIMLVMKRIEQRTVITEDSK